MKLILILVLLIVAGVGGYYVYNNYNDQQKVGDVTMTSENLDNNSMTSGAMVTPISHASMILTLSGQVIYNDPVGGKDAYANHPSPNIILLSDIHGDHLDGPTLSAISKEDTIIVAPQAVADELPEGLPGTLVVLANGQITTQKGISIEATPMYNVPETPASPHTKGRGNGYILSAEDKRIYIAGDTGPTDEMKALQNIDEAFIPMNLPYTMSVEDAAAAVIEFKPKVVHPYHYRGPEGLADINKFKELVEAGDSNIKVELLNFYAE